MCVMYTMYSGRELNMSRPFLHIYDDKGKKTNVVFISHAFTREDLIDKYKIARRQGYHFLGISSYIDFPGLIGNRRITNPHDPLHNPNDKAWKYDYFKLVKGWCHCFRQPELYIPPNMPMINISESDFSSQPPAPATSGSGNKDRPYDFIYICLVDNDKCTNGGQAHNRNWELAQKCLDVMCNKFKLKGLLIGRVNCTLPKGCHKLMETTGFLDYNVFVTKYDQARFIFCPNIYDASPRVLTEALLRGLPGLVNHNILGGWKYITEQSGELFHGMDDFEVQLQKLLDNYDNYRPREHYIRHYGRPYQGKELLDFVTKVIPERELNFDVSKTQYLYPGV